MNFIKIEIKMIKKHLNIMPGESTWTNPISNME